jgi:hypothetical protein
MSPLGREDHLRWLAAIPVADSVRISRLCIAPRRRTEVPPKAGQKGHGMCLFGSRASDSSALLNLDR